MLTCDGHIKLGDFGSCLRLQEDGMVRAEPILVTSIKCTNNFNKMTLQVLHNTNDLKTSDF